MTASPFLTLIIHPPLGLAGLVGTISNLNLGDTYVLKAFAQAFIFTFV